MRKLRRTPEAAGAQGLPSGFCTRNCLWSGWSLPSLSFRVTARLAPRKERKGPMGAGFEASEQQGEAYILTGEKTVQLQRAENAILLRIQMSHGALGTGS